MNKTERINTEMRFINNRAVFTLSELMREFEISRATALRDIREIEALGVPLEATVGRDGGYAVMPNSLLPPVRFTDLQVQALFIAFMASANRQLPYLQSRKTLQELLLALLPQTHQDRLLALNQLLVFPGTNLLNPDLLNLSDRADPMLEQLLATAVSHPQLVVTLADGTHRWWLQHLFLEAGSWQVEAFDLDVKHRVNHPVSAITHIEPLPAPVSTRTLRRWQAAATPAPNLVLDLDATAITQYQKYHPLRLTLTYLDPFQTTARISASLPETSDWTLLADWLLFLGAGASAVHLPDRLRTAIAARVVQLQQTL